VFRARNLVLGTACGDMPDGIVRDDRSGNSELLTGSIQSRPEPVRRGWPGRAAPSHRFLHEIPAGRGRGVISVGYSRSDDSSSPWNLRPRRGPDVLHRAEESRGRLMGYPRRNHTTQRSLRHLPPDSMEPCYRHRRTNTTKQEQSLQDPREAPLASIGLAGCHSTVSQGRHNRSDTRHTASTAIRQSHRSRESLTTARRGNRCMNATIVVYDTRIPAADPHGPPSAMSPVSCRAASSGNKVASGPVDYSISM